MPDTSLDRLRSAVALVHATAGSTLLMELADGDTLLAGPMPSADLTACQLRRVLATCAHDPHMAAVVTARVVSVSVGGTIEPLGAGLYRDRGHTDALLFTTQLGPLLAEQVLRRLEVAEARTGQLSVALKDDDVLGTTVVALRGTGHPEQTHDVALAGAGALLAEEVVMSGRLGGLVRDPQSAGE